MTKGIDGAIANGELLALITAVREIAVQVERLSEGEPFLAKCLEKTTSAMDALTSAFGEVTDVTDENRAYVERMLAVAKQKLENTFAPASVTTGPSVRFN